jgi:DNA-binding transcriptional LysR family regulator
MDSRRLLIFREVARAGSISGAARVIGWTQPAVSQHLRTLEREVGSRLLLRGAGGVELTEPGRVLLARADAVAGQLHMAGEELAAMSQLRRGTVRLAAYPSAAATLVPRVVAALLDRHPDIDLRLTEAEPPEAIGLVQAGDVDVALVFGYDGLPIAGAGLHWLPLADEPVHLVLPPDHRLGTRSQIVAADLADEPWIMGCVRCREHALALCTAAGFAAADLAVHHLGDRDDAVAVQLELRGPGSLTGLATDLGGLDGVLAVSGEDLTGGPD